jgi:hypothetical protein
MNYLSSSNYFHIKNPFSILFIQFKRVLDWASITENRRGFSARNPRHGEQCPRDGGFIPWKPRGSLAKDPGQRGIKNPGPSDLESRDQIRFFPRPNRYLIVPVRSKIDVRNLMKARSILTHGILIQGHRSNWPKGSAWPNLIHPFTILRTRLLPRACMPETIWAARLKINGPRMPTIQTTPNHTIEDRLLGFKLTKGYAPI